MKRVKIYFSPKLVFYDEGKENSWIPSIRPQRIYSVGYPVYKFYTVDQPDVRKNQYPVHPISKATSILFLFHIIQFSPMYMHSVLWFHWHSYFNLYLNNFVHNYGHLLLSVTYTFFVTCYNKILSCKHLCFFHAR